MVASPLASIASSPCYAAHRVYVTSLRFPSLRQVRHKLASAPALFRGSHKPWHYSCCAGQELLTGAPAMVDVETLREYHIQRLE
jgi:hypothetical protein